MRLGIDFGTTRTVVAAVDRGNYPVVGFHDGEGGLCEWLPSRAEGVSSFKRALGRARLGDPIHALTTRFLAQLADALRERANLVLAPGEPLEAAVGVPANASSTQRFLTADAFRRAGFAVLGVVNEPSAAGLEFAHRHRRALSGVREHVAVYDLGGGTFDVSLIDLGEDDHRVVATDGASELGGDDFDRAIADLVAERAGLSALTAAERAALTSECCARKEALTPQTRKVAFDLSPVRAGLADLTLTADELLAACAPLVARTVDLIENLAGGPGSPIPRQSLAGVYVVGGASALPSVGRALRERFGRLVHRSPYSHAATAIGLAIAAGEWGTRFALADCFTRHFGVWREAEAGAHAVFDPIFRKDTPLPPRGAAPLTRVRRYRARHDIGHFRFLECSRLDGAAPSGDLHLGREVRFPFAAALRSEPLDARPVAPLDGAPEVEERYECTPDGMVRVTLTSDGFSRAFDLA